MRQPAQPDRGVMAIELLDLLPQHRKHSYALNTPVSNHHNLANEQN